MSTNIMTNDQLRNLYRSLPIEARAAIDARAETLALIEETETERRGLWAGGIPEEYYGSRALSWDHVRAALCEYLPGRCATPRPAGTHRPYERPSVPSVSRVVEMANLLRANEALGAETAKPAGRFQKVMIDRGSLLDGVDFGVLISKQQPNAFYVFTKLAEMAGPTPTRYFGPFDATILPNE